MFEDTGSLAKLDVWRGVPLHAAAARMTVEGLMILVTRTWNRILQHCCLAKINIILMNTLYIVIFAFLN
jgi:hypothetical protein